MEHGLNAAPISYGNILLLGIAAGLAVLVLFCCASLLTMSIRAGVIRTIPFQQVDAAPYAEASAEGNHKGLQDFDLQDFDGRVKKFRGSFLLDKKSLRPVGYTPEIVNFLLPAAAGADFPMYPGAWGKTKGPQMRVSGSEFVGVHHIVHVRRFEFEAAVKKLFDVKKILLVVVAGQFIVGVLGQVVLVGQKRPDAAELQNALTTVHDGKLVPAHEFVTGLLVRCAVAWAVAAGVRSVVKVDGFTAKGRRQLFEGGTFGTAQKNLRIHVADDSIGVVFVQRLELGLRLQDQASRNFPAADGGDQLFQVWDLPDVGALVDQATHMDGQPPAVYIVGLFAEQIEQLGVHHRDQEVEGAVCVTHDEEQRRFPVAQSVQFQLIVGGDLPQFGDVEGGQSGTAGNQNRLGCFACRQLVETVLPHRKVIWFTFCQILEHEVHRVLEFLVVLPHLHDVEQFQQGRKVPFFDRRFIVDIGNKRGVQKFFCLLPERITAFSLPAGVGHEGRDQLQDVLFRVDIVEGVVMHRLFEVDGVEDFDAVALLQKGVADFQNRGAFRVCENIGTVHLQQIRFYEIPRVYLKTQKCPKRQEKDTKGFYHRK